MTHTTLLETNMSPEKSILKMIFLFPRWDMLVHWRVTTNPELVEVSNSGTACRTHQITSLAGNGAYFTPETWLAEIVVPWARWGVRSGHSKGDFMDTMGTHGSFIFRGHNPYIRGLKPSFFMDLGSKGILYQNP